MKNILFLLTLILFVSCNDNIKNRSLYELEQQSLQSGIVIDTIFSDFYFGMPDWRIKQITIYNDFGKYRFDTPELDRYNFNMYSSFYNDSLYSLRFVVYNFENYTLSKTSFDNVVQRYVLKYDMPDTTYTEKKDKGLVYNDVWLKGNLKINVNYDGGKSYAGLSILYEDLRRITYGEDIIHLSEYNNEYFYTKDYYEKIYLPNKKQQLKQEPF